MTVPMVRVVEGGRVAPTAHPLATQSGVDALLHIIAADQHWRPISKAGKAALRRAYTRALAEAVADGADVAPMPTLGDDVHPATVRALTARQLVADGALTGLAVEVLRWVLPLDDHRRPRPAVTVRPVGGVL